MTFKKHNWLKYGRSGDMIRISMLDYSSAKIEEWTANNQKDYQKILKIIKDKYGFDYGPAIEPEFKDKNILDTEFKW